MLWIEPPSNSPASHSDLHPLVAQTLVQRGIQTPEAARAFLDPEAYSPAPPADLPGLSAAADRVEAAIQRHEPICVWGDFDVDGQTSTTILHSALLALGADVVYHIPIRARESHGVNLPVLAEVIDRGARLVLTCDTGIGASEAVEYARGRGVDFVITDHHDLPEDLPGAAALTNPKLLPPSHPLASLSGSGVAYELAAELLNRIPSSRLSSSDLVDLAALGLVADLARLTGDSRYLVQRGLEALRHTKRLGLRTMLELAEVDARRLTEEHIGFTLAPRLNALGRLGDANPAVEFFLTSDPGRARLIAVQLEGLNAQRQMLTDQVTQAAEAQLRANPALLAEPVLVLGHTAWPGGVVGIAASRLVERYYRPAILLSMPEGEAARGSARSVEGIDITAAISAQKDLLLGFGGHPMAAGLSIQPDRLPEFRRRLARTVEKMTGGVKPEPALAISAWLDLPDASLELAETLEQLAPFGPGNEKPVLAARGLRLVAVAAIGRNKEHRKLTVADETGETRTILWWNGAGEDLPDGRFDLAFTLRASDWRGVLQAQLEFVDFRVVEEKPVEIRRPALEVLDFRREEHPLSALNALPGETLVWAEGEDKKKFAGVDRSSLGPCETLVIWTAPASPEILRTALETARPSRLVLFGRPAAADDPKLFLERLAGLVKFAIHQRQGATNFPALAEATAQREAAVRLGLEWLAAKGQIVFESRGEELHLAAGDQAGNPYAVGELESGIRTVLAETHAYRLYFSRADKDSLTLHPETG